MSAREGAPDDVAHRDLDYRKIPYNKPQPAGMVPDLVVPGLLQAVRDPMGGDPRLSTCWPVH